MGTERVTNSQKLGAQRRIRKSQLQRHAYTLSLMNEGMRLGLLTSQDVGRVQNVLMQILQKLIMKYTKGESSSVTTETAEGILTSILYAVDAYLYSIEEDQAIHIMKTMNSRHLYERGVDEVAHCFEESKQLYKDIAATKLDVQVDAYNMTLDESIPVFFRKYGVIFEAHHTMASIDYPLAVDDMKLQGVYYIKQYMEHLQLENEFCRLFDQQELRELLIYFGRECRFDYRIELFNIFELVMKNALFSVLSGNDAKNIIISPQQFMSLEQQLTNLNEPQLRAVISHGMERLQQQLSIEAPLKMYMESCKEELIQRVMNAARHRSLHSIIITEKEAGIKSIFISFREQDRMSDVEIRRWLQELSTMNRTEDKINLILTQFHSFHDYLDMLDSDCLYGGEFAALFQALGDVELAILAKIVYYEELRNATFDLAIIVRLDNQYAAEWQKQFAEFLKRLSMQQLRVIEKYMDEIDYEQITFH